MGHASFDKVCPLAGRFSEKLMRSRRGASSQAKLLVECGRPGIHCVPFRDLVDWMNAQDPAVLATVQNHRSNLGGCPYPS